MPNGAHFGADPDGRFVPVEVHGPGNAVDKLYVAVCDRGAQGGGLGTPGQNQLNGRPIPAKCRLELEPGDVVSVMTPGGGGWGLERERGTGNREP